MSTGYRVVENILLDMYVSIRQVMERCIVGVITTSRKQIFRADHEKMRRETFWCLSKAPSKNLRIPFSHSWKCIVDEAQMLHDIML